MVVIADQPRLDPEVVQQPPGDPGILTGHRSHATQCRDSAKRDIAEIANRRCDYVKPG
jgi:hypothetical protein